MAALATAYNNLFKGSRPAARRSAVAKAIPVRSFANEDIYFHIKRIDNSRLVRQADPKTGGVCWKLIGSVAAAAVLLMAATVLVNLSPPNPYFTATLRLWHQGHFLNFNGLTRLVNGTWPFIALGYLIYLASRRGGDPENRSRR